MNIHWSFPFALFYEIIVKLKTFVLAAEICYAVYLFIASIWYIFYSFSKNKENSVQIRVLLVTNFLFFLLVYKLRN